VEVETAIPEILPVVGDVGRVENNIKGRAGVEPRLKEAGKEGGREGAVCE
jgi:hypothetical protein